MKKEKKLFLWVGAAILIFTGILLALNFYIKDKIKQGIENELSSLSYDELSVNVIRGNSSITNAVFKVGKYSIKAQKLQILDFHYYQYFIKDKIVIGQLDIGQPKVTLNDIDTIKAKDEKGKKKNVDLKINSIKVKGGYFKKSKKDSTVNSLFLAINSLGIESLVYKSGKQGESPISYRTTNFEVDSIYYDLNDQHYLTVGKAKKNERNLEVLKIKIIPKFNKSQFDRQIAYEKDRIELNVERVLMNDFSWENTKQNLVIKSPLLNVENTRLSMYRNKLLPDDPRTKPLYGRMLREMDLKIKFDSIKINNSGIVYQEKLKEERPPAKIHLDNLNITINNLTNLLSDSLDIKQTIIHAQGNFMDEALLEFTYDFKVQNQQDQFNIQGKLGSLSAKALNPFLIPAMGIEVEGKIKSVFFNFRGNNYNASGDMQLAYQDFKVYILKKGEREKKSILSGIANILIKNDVVDNKVVQKDVSVERDQTKSFWNFLWLLIKDGTIKTLI